VNGVNGERFIKLKAKNGQVKKRSKRNSRQEQDIELQSHKEVIVAKGKVDKGTGGTGGTEVTEVTESAKPKKGVTLEEVVKRLEKSEKRADIAERKVKETETLIGKLQAVAPKRRAKLAPRVPIGTSAWAKVEGKNHEEKQRKVVGYDKDKVLAGYREEPNYNEDGSYNPDIFVRLAPAKK